MGKYLGIRMAIIVAVVFIFAFFSGHWMGIAQSPDYMDFETARNFDIVVHEELGKIATASYSYSIGVKPSWSGGKIIYEGNICQRKDSRMAAIIPLYKLHEIINKNIKEKGPMTWEDTREAFRPLAKEVAEKIMAAQ